MGKNYLDKIGLSHLGQLIKNKLNELQKQIASIDTIQYTTCTEEELQSAIIYYNNGDTFFQVSDTTTKNGIALTNNQNGTFNLKGTLTSSSAEFTIFVDTEKTGLISGEEYVWYSNKSLPTGLNIRLENYNNTAWDSSVFPGNQQLSSSNSTTTGKITLTQNKVRFGVIFASSSGSTIDISDVKIILKKKDS